LTKSKVRKGEKSLPEKNALEALKKINSKRENCEIGNPATKKEKVKKRSHRKFFHGKETVCPGGGAQCWGKRHACKGGKLLGKGETMKAIKKRREDLLKRFPLGGRKAPEKKPKKIAFRKKTVNADKNN